MRDDDGTSISSIFWYEEGRWGGLSKGRREGYRTGSNHGYDQGVEAARDEYARQQIADWNAGYRRIHINDYNSLVNHCDEQGIQIAKLLGLIDALKEGVNGLEKDLKSSQQRTLDARREGSKTNDYHVGLINCLWALQRAAEQGKTHYPEYAELKEAIDHMQNYWRERKEIIFKADALGPYIWSLCKALDA